MSEARKPVRSAVVKPEDRMPSTTTKASPVAIQFGPLLPSAVPHWNTQVHISVSDETSGTSQARSRCFFTWCRNSSASDLYCRRSFTKSSSTTTMPTSVTSSETLMSHIQAEVPSVSSVRMRVPMPS